MLAMDRQEFRNLVDALCATSCPKDDDETSKLKKILISMSELFLQII